MKILFIEPAPERFGGYYRAYHTARSLVKLGHDVTLILCGDRGICWHPKRLNAVHGLTIIYPPNIAKRKAIAKLVKVPYVLSWLLKKWDAIHVFATVHPENFAAVLMCRLLRRPLIVDWDDFWQDSPLGRDGAWWMRFYVRYTENTGIRLAPALTVTSEFLHSKAKHFGVRRIHKMANGVWHEQFDLVPRQTARERLSVAPNSLVLLAFGNHFLQHRGRLLLMCVQSAIEIEPSAVIFLNWDPVKMWHAEAPDEYLAPQVYEHIRNVGHIPEKELGLYLGACDFTLFLVQDIPAEWAGFSIRLGTYLNGERPIATNTARTEACRLVRKFDCGVVGQTPRETAMKLVEAWQDPVRFHQLEAGARRAKKALSYDRIASELAGFYRSVL